MHNDTADRIAALTGAVTRWAANRSDIKAVALVGSGARGDHRPDSDIDFVIITDDPASYRSDNGWIGGIAPGCAVLRWEDADYGAVWVRNIFLEKGPEIEFAFGLPSWASGDPVDPGTLGVVRSGFRILLDPHNILGSLARAVLRLLSESSDDGPGVTYHTIDGKDEELITLASRVIARNYNDPRHTVGSAVRCSSGKVYQGVDVDSCGYGPCAEPVAIGQAISNGDAVFEAIVAVAGPEGAQCVIPPCGNCRQIICDYAPKCWVIIEKSGRPVKVRARDLLPDAYRNFS